jgi:DNA-binding NtrC family response regulator
LRAVEEKTIQRLGASHDIPVDFRLIAATNLDLIQQVKLGEFREDLFFRLNVFPIELPPLRERTTDIPLLATHFCREFAERDNITPPRISNAVMNRLMGHSWPGNVRELRNCLERALIMTPEGGDLELWIPVGNGSGQCHTMTHCLELGWDLKRMEDEYILAVIRHTNGHRNRAARILGIDRRTLYRKLERIELEAAVPCSSGNCGCADS